jgi:hypothetical protein
MKPSCGMLLDDEDLFVFASFLSARLRCVLKAALATVFRESGHSYRIIVRCRGTSALKCITFREYPAQQPALQGFESPVGSNSSA